MDHDGQDIPEWNQRSRWNRETKASGKLVSDMRRKLELAMQNRESPEAISNIESAIDPYSEKLLPGIRRKLDSALESRDIKNYTIQIESASSPGDNFLGFIGKITVTGLDKSNEKITLNWIIKIAPPLEHPHRRILKYELVYAREVYMYERIFPKFLDFQNSKSMKQPFNNYPKFIFSCLEPSNESLCMENIKLRGYILKRRQDPLDYKHVKLALKAYGKFHAISFAFKDQKTEEFEALVKDMRDVITYAQDTAKIAVTQKPFMENALKLLDEDTDGPVIVKFRKFVEKFAYIFNDAVNMTNRYSVISHGDCWVNNLLWKYDDTTYPTRPTSVCLLDFQLARYGSPACDLSHFLFTATEKSLRDDHYDDMIKLYYESLCAHLIELGSDPVQLFPFSELENELKRFSVVGLYWAIMVLKVMTKDEELEKKKNENVYKERMRGVILDYYNKGYFGFL